MTKDQAKDKWLQTRGMAKRLWGRLTNGDFKKREVSKDRLYGAIEDAIQNKFGDGEAASRSSLDKMTALTFLIVAGLGMGCTATEGVAAEKPIRGETAAVQRDEVRTETKEAVQAMQDYTYERKEEFVAKSNKELAEIQAELDKLAAAIDRSKGEAKADAKVRLDAVRENWAQAKQQLDDAEAATESTWNDVKHGVERSRDTVKESFDKTRQWLSDKIEP